MRALLAVLLAACDGGFVRVPVDDLAPAADLAPAGPGVATHLAFSVEPTGGSTQPSAIFAELPLT